MRTHARRHRAPPRATLVAACLLLAGAACGGGGDPPVGPGGGGGASMRATIDGVAYVGDPALTGIIVQTDLPGGMHIRSHFSETLMIELALGRIREPGTYPLGVSPGSNAGGVGLVWTPQDNWETPLTGAVGSVTITRLSESRVAGTFSFVAWADYGRNPAAVRRVTAGTFDVPLPGTYGPPSEDERGGVLTATVDGRPWSSAVTVAYGDPAHGLMFLADDSYNGVAPTGYEIEWTIGPVAGPGTVPIVAATARGPGETWWGGLAPLDGTLTVTSLTATRMAGTFRLTLAADPLRGGPPLSITNGAFDVLLSDPARLPP